MQILQGIEQAKLIHFDFIGNPENLSKRIRNALEKQNVKLSKYLSRLPWKFNFYVDVDADFKRTNVIDITNKMPKKYKGSIEENGSIIHLIYGTVG